MEEEEKESRDYFGHAINGKKPVIVDNKNNKVGIK
jgi:hypothetical protein